VEPLERATGTQHPVSGTVDRPWVVHVDDSRGRQRDAGGLIQPVEQGAKAALVGNRVVVQQRHVITGRDGHAGVVAAGKPAILRQHDDPHRGKLCPDVVGRAVGRIIVDQNCLDSDTSLRVDRAQAGSKVATTVPVDDDDRDERRRRPLRHPVGRRDHGSVIGIHQRRDGSRRALILASGW